MSTFLIDRGCSKKEIGSLGSWFASGIVLLSIPAGRLVRRFGGKPVLVVALVGYALADAIFPYVGGGYVAFGVVRFFDGAFSVAVWVSSETVLLSRAPPEKKAYFTSIYALALALGYVVGPLLAFGFVPVLGKAAAFVIGGLIAILSAIYVAHALGPDAVAPLGETQARDAGAEAQRLSSTALFSRIKTSCLATFSYGYFQASVVLFLPPYLMRDKAFSEASTVIVPAFFAAGMLVFANLAANFGDRVGHLNVMRGLAVIGLACILGFVVVDRAVALYVLVFVAGASLASISPVSLALQGIVTPPRDLTRSGGMYNASYALGMLVGPSISGVLYDGMGGGAMNLHFALIWIFFVAFTIVFRKDDPRARATA